LFSSFHCKKNFFKPSGQKIKYTTVQKEDPITEYRPLNKQTNK